MIDVILDCFEQNVTEKELFLKILRKFKIHRDELRNIVLLKFMFCQVYKTFVILYVNIFYFF